MTLVIELLAYLVAEVVGDLLLEGGARGAVRVLRTRTGRYVTAALSGLGFGLVWGYALRGGPTWPRLLWVSLALGAAALLLAAGRAGAQQPPVGAGTRLWRRALVPPWLWSAERLVGVAVLNGALALGIASAFRPDVS